MINYILLCKTYVLFDIFQDVITYDIPPDTDEARHARDYFFVTPDTGELHLKQSLTGDDTRVTQYRVSPH